MTSASNQKPDQDANLANVGVRVPLTPTYASACKKGSIADALAMPGAVDIEFDPPRMTLRLKPVDFD